MALTSRRRRGDSGVSYWPGFVDAMATILLVIMFLLTVFMLAQFLLAREVSGQDTALVKLRSQVAELTELLALEEVGAASLQASLAGLTDEVDSAESERDRLAGLLAQMTEKNDAAEQQIVVLRDKIEGAKQERNAVLSQIEQRQQVIVDLRTQAEKKAARLAALTQEVDVERSAKSKAQTRAAKAEDLIVDLRSEAEKRQTELAALGRELESTLSARNQALSDLEDRKVLIIDLRGKASQAREDLANVTASIEAERSAMSLVRDELAARKKAEQEARNEADKAERQIVVLRSRIEKNRTRLATLDQIAQENQQLVVLQSKSKTRLAELERSLTVLNSKVAAAVKAGAEGEAKLAAQRQIVIDLRSEAEKQRTRVAGLSRTVSAERSGKSRALAQIELLNQQLGALRRQLGALQAALDASDIRDQEQQTRIANLGRRLNVALARKVQELSKYRSEFFGRLREILSARSDIKIVGDRFVFQSEVLFPSSSANLNAAGHVEIANLASALLELEQQIPTELNWVLRIDGHTDARPIRTFQFPSNWELSSARAISVVKKLIQAGVSPNRLVAAGFGQFQPLDQNETDEAYRTNRRIELKLTER